MREPQATRVGELLRETRKKRNVSLRALADNLHVSAALLSMIEQGKHRPTLDLIAAAAEFFGEDVDVWCAADNRVHPDLERDIARAVRENPNAARFFRTMFSKK